MWRHVALQFNLNKLKESCMRALARNADKFILSSEWLRIDECLLREFLSDSELIVSDEFTLYKALCRWLLVSERVANFKPLLTEFLSLIRFSQMNEKDLLFLEDYPLAIRNDEKNGEKWVHIDSDVWRV